MASIGIRTPGEIEIMRQAGLMLQKVLEATCKAAKVGVTTGFLDRFAEKMIRDLGGIPGFKGYRGYPASICTSINDQVVHAIPSNRVLNDGDIVGIDAGVLYKEFHTDACRTVIIGKVSSKIRHFVETTEHALEEAMKEVKEGAYVGDISAVIQEVLERQGYHPVAECTGHGVGRHLHEPPDIYNKGKRGTGPKLKTGMTIAIEPIATMGSPAIKTLADGWTIVTRDHSLSAHFEHTILVTKNGFELIA